MKKRLYSTIAAVTASIFFLLLPINAWSQEPAKPAAQAPARPVFRMPVQVKSAEVSSDNKVTFRLYAKDASGVKVSGDWLPGYGSSVDMARNDTGMFSLTVGPLEPELYSYTFIVDGVRMIDPNNVQELRDGSRYLSFFIIPGDQSDLYMYNDVPHGSLAKIWYNSPVLGMQRRLYVYTPAGYEDSNSEYPVLYLLHGAGGDEDAWTTMGRAIEIMDNLIAQSKARPMIVVMTNGNANQEAAQNDIPLPEVSPQERMASYARYAGKFEESVVKDVIPFIQKHFRVYTDKDHRAIAGLSMGGAHTQTITNDNPKMFSYIGVFSMGLMNFGRQNQDAAKLAEERSAKVEALKNSGYKLYWIGVGKDDFLYKSVQDLKADLDKHSFKYIYRETPGGHTWTNWRIYLSEFAPLLFK